MPGLRGRALAVALEGLALHRKPLGAAVAGYLESADPDLASPALLVLGPQPGPELLAYIAPLAKSTALRLRQTAIEVGLVYNLARVEEVALWWAFADDTSMRARAYTWLALLGREAGVGRLLKMIDDPIWGGDALWALGYAGYVDAVSAALDLLDDPERGPLAAELMVGIVGLPVDAAALWAEPTATLPTPRPAAIRDWWRARRDDFDRGVRYQYGAPMDRGSLLRALQRGNMRRRHNHGLELAVRSRGRDFLATRSFGQVQKLRTPT